MKIPGSWFSLSLLCVLTGMVEGDLSPQPQMEFERGAMGTNRADWQGVSGRTYFLQFSMDMNTWHYAPLIAFGEGEQQRGMSSNSHNLFVRLHYGDFSGIESLDAAMMADLDGDGLSNIQEVTFGYNPFQASSTTDGADASLDPDEDGLSNAAEQVAGTDLMKRDHPILQLEISID